jgi:hypothetical protein
MATCLDYVASRNFLFHDTSMSLEEIRDFLSYDPETGEFRWIKKPATQIMVGAVAGNVSQSMGGYRRIRFRNKYYLAHRLATSSKNKCNTRIRKDNTSGFRGVSYFAQTKRWAGELKLDGRRVWSGYFATAEEAARARDTAALKYHGEFARLNFPGDHRTKPL